MLEFLKANVQVVVLERDEDGQIVQERLGETATFYQPEKVPEFLEEVQAQIKTANESALSDEGATVTGDDEASVLS